MLGRKDGGPESHVYAYGLEIKSLFSILLLRFEDGTREAFHSHAFNAVSWLLAGWLVETVDDEDPTNIFMERVDYDGWFERIVTRKERFHQVRSIGRSWVLSFRGPWDQTWRESADGESYTLTNGRVRI
jgi:hypothetical protein